MKLSDNLTIISYVLTLILSLLLIGRVINTSCFSWIDYGAMFVTLFTNLGINITAALGK